MNFSSERYVRLYVRDTNTWIRWTWEARATFALLLRKLDRAGILPLDGDSAEDAIATQTGLPAGVIGVALPQLTQRNKLGQATLLIEGDHLRAPNFRAAQEASASPALRAQEYRDRNRVTKSDAPVTLRDDGVTKRDGASRIVTGRHSSLAEPSEPSRAELRDFAPDGAGAVVAHIRDPLFAGVDGTPLSEPPRCGEGRPGPETSDSGAEPTRRKAQRQKRQSTAAPMPFTLAELCTALRETSNGQIAVDPFDATLAKPLTSAARALAEGGGVLADVRLAGEYAAAVIPTWPSGEPMTLAWLARSGNLNGLVTRARAWNARGRNHTPATANLARGGVPVVTREQAAVEAAKHAREGPAVNGEQRVSWDELARSGNGKP